MILNEILASQQIGFPILSAIIFLPVAAIILLALIRDERMAFGIALAASVIELLLSAVMILNFDGATANVQFVEKSGMYHLGVDGISALFIPVTALLGLLAVLSSEAAVKNNVRGYLMAMLGFQAAMMGAFAAVDLMLFWVFFVAELVPSYFLIARHGTGEKRHAAAGNYLFMMAAAAVVLLLGFIQLGSASGGATTFNLVELLSKNIPASAQTQIFFLLCLGFAIKAPIFPFHTWLPRVLEHGPVVGASVFLVGVKLGTYGFLRFVIPLLPDASRDWFWLLALLGGIGMVYGALIALIQTNLRRLLAFASLSHMGVVMLGLFSLNYQGLQGGLLQMINLGITGAGLFFVAGFLHTRLGPPELARMGGLNQRVPMLAMTFLVIGLAGVGMPGTSGFNGEHLVMIGAYQTHWIMALTVGVGTLLTAAYFLWFYQRAFVDAKWESNAGTAAVVPDLKFRELLIAGAMATVIFAMGLFTGPFLKVMEGSLQAVAKRVEGSASPIKKPLAVAPSIGR